MATTAESPIDLSSPNKMEIDGNAITENEILEYREMIEELGTFPDKVLINTLTMIAEDHADSKVASKKVYECIRTKLLFANGDHKLPIMYVIDSILKNAKGCYIPLFEDDAKSWMKSVYRALPDDERRTKLKKVWNTWKDFDLFSNEKWIDMGECFKGTGGGNNGDKSPRSTSPTGSTTVAGIPRSATGALIMSANLRREMQKILDELQNDIDNELEKVSLERLADINPDLLANIKRAAEDAFKDNHQSTATGERDEDKGESNKAPMKPSFLTELRSEEMLKQSKAWAKLELKHEEHSNEIIQALRACVKDGSSSDSRYTQSDAVGMTHVLAAASAAGTLLSKALERRDREEKRATQQSVANAHRGPSSGLYGATVDKKLFTNNGIKKKNLALIGMLYEVGLPFVSSSDGRRFKTQLELSKHLDRLFKKSQIEKSMARTEERGWYSSDRVWTGHSKEEDTNQAAAQSATAETTATSEEDADPDSFTEVADETRDKCVVCGINFKMFFDNDDGAYKYKNCREIEVMNDDVAENESDMMLVHVTCWRGLGSPNTLDIDQTLRD